MRPVNKGPSPYTTISEYSDARGYLIDRIGEYCSYCERKIPASLAVEHVEPKTHHEDKELLWSNLLLACTNCNSTKGHTDVVLDEYVWPHLDRSLDYFIYTSSSKIEVNENLSEQNQIRAEKTLKLVGLNKKPKATDLKRQNRLWRQRLEAWNKAEIQKKRYIDSANKITAQEFIVDISIETGFFSVWMKVFEEFPEIRRKLINTYKGTNL
jgi:uncharacterized protein (TIGR02646 family)